LSSDDDDDNDRTNRRESISPQPADSACSSPAPSTGKVEAALNANTCRAEHELRSSPAESELNTISLPRKARMKDQVLFVIVDTFVWITDSSLGYNQFFKGQMWNLPFVEAARKLQILE
jgi:sentrin-specific protease 6